MKRKSITYLMAILLLALLLGACGINTDSDEDVSIEESGETSKKASNKNSKKDDDDKKDNKSSNKKSDISSEEWLKELAIENIESLKALAGDESYIECLGGSEEINNLVKAWSKADIDEDKKVVIAYIEKSSVLSFIKLAGGDLELSETAEEYLVNNTGRTVSNIITARMGTTTLAASSIANYTKSYIAECEIENQVWMIPTDVDGVAYCVNFINSGDGVITVAVNFITYEPDKSIKKSVKPTLGPFDLEETEIEW